MSKPTRPTCGTCPHRVFSHLYRMWETDALMHIGRNVYLCRLNPPVPHPVEDVQGCNWQPEVDADHPGCIHHPDMAAYVAAWQRSKAPQHDDPMAHTCGHQEAFGGYALAYCPGHEPDTGCGIEWMACEQCRDNPELLARARTWLLTHKCRSKERS